MTKASEKLSDFAPVHFRDGTSLSWPPRAQCLLDCFLSSALSPPDIQSQ